MNDLILYGLVMLILLIAFVIGGISLLIINNYHTKKINLLYDNFEKQMKDMPDTVKEILISLAHQQLMLKEHERNLEEITRKKINYDIWGERSTTNYPKG
jgi:cell division protein FtsL